MRGNTYSRTGLIRLAVVLLALAAGSVLSGCTALGTVSGLIVGGALGGPEGAAAGAEIGFLFGAATDLAVVEGIAHSSHHHGHGHYASDHWYGDNVDYEWYADGWDADDNVIIINP